MTLLEQLQTLAPLAATATPGEWQQSHRKGVHGMCSTQVYDAHGATIASIAWHAKPIDEDGGIGTYREANAAFIAAARNLLTPENVARLIAGAAAIALATCEVCLGTGKLDDDLAWDEPGTENRCSKCPYCQAPAPAVTGWVAVADGLPEPEEGYTEFSPWVLAYTTRGRQIQASYYGPLKGWRTPTGRADVTHWMPQPTPPATMEGGQPNV